MSSCIVLLKRSQFGFVSLIMHRFFFLSRCCFFNFLNLEFSSGLFCFWPSIRCWIPKTFPAGSPCQLYLKLCPRCSRFNLPLLSPPSRRADYWQWSFPLFFSFFTGIWSGLLIFSCSRMIILLVEGNITNELGCISHLVSSLVKFQDSLTPRGPQGCCGGFWSSCAN